MPVSKKRKKDDRKRPRERAPSAAGAPPEPPPGRGGFLSRMRGGMRDVVGAGAKKKESPLSKILTWAVVAVVAYFVARRFGLLP